MCKFNQSKFSGVLTPHFLILFPNQLSSFCQPPLRFLFPLTSLLAAFAGFMVCTSSTAHTTGGGGGPAYAMPHPSQQARRPCYGKCSKCRQTICIVAGEVKITEAHGHCRMCNQNGKLFVDKGVGHCYNRYKQIEKKCIVTIIIVTIMSIIPPQETTHVRFTPPGRRDPPTRNDTCATLCRPSAATHPEERTHVRLCAAWPLRPIFLYQFAS